MVEEVTEALNLMNEGTQDSVKLFQAISSATSDFASTFAKAFENIKNALIPLVGFIGKIVDKIQAAE